MKPSAPIGMFDSGVGGLTVAKEIMSQIPGEDIIYFGDTARVPYGCKSKETIIGYSRQIIAFLQTNNVKTIVIACNTATAFALETLQKEIDIPIIDVVKPGAKVAKETTKNKKIGIIGTEATVQTKIYNTYIQNNEEELQVFGKACPLLVPLVEEGLLDDPVTVEIASRYLKELKESKIDTLVMGCTHYPLIAKTLGNIMGEEVTLVNPAYETARALKTLLETTNMKNDKTQGEHKFYVSDGAEKFKAFANTILPCKVQEIKDIKIEQY